MNLLRRICLAGVLPAVLAGAGVPASGAPPQPAVAATAAASAAGADPLEHLRRRLAEKLGASERDPDPAAAASKRPAPVMRVVNRAPGEARSEVEARARTARATGPGGSSSSAADLHEHVSAPPLRSKPLASSASEPSASAAPAPAGELPRWSYTGAHGPHAWHDLHPDYAGCASGQRQSPIDIRDGFKLGLEPVQFDYRATAAGVIDTGHTIRVDLAAGSSIEVSGRRYELVEFHFHRPSEEAIDGRRSEMTVHLLHRDADGRHAMVAVLLERGAAQPLIQRVWNNLPLERDTTQPVRDPLDPSALLPTLRDYYTFMGSLTTPPCSEGVLWIVMKTPLQLSDEQLSIFARLYPMNARPLQPANARMIKQSR